MVEPAESHRIVVPCSNEPKRTFWNLLRDEGMLGVARRAAALVYRRGIRKLLPTSGHYRRGDVSVAIPRKFGDHLVPDTWKPSHAKDLPTYEAALVSGIREQVRSGDRVVIVGGGLGVTTCVAAAAVGPEGSVTCYEGSAENADLTRRAAVLNGVGDRTTVHHAVVASALSVWGDYEKATAVPPAGLPACDVLELDCEGAELEILNGMPSAPRVVLVEAHGFLGAPTETVRLLLQQLGYDVTDLGVAEPGMRAFCEEKDVRVLVGVRPEGDPR